VIDTSLKLTATAKSINKATRSLICEIVISGTYRKDIEGLKRIYEQLTDLGCRILSPVNILPSKEESGFVYMKGEETEGPENIELRHLQAMQRSKFVWLHAPDGYVGPSGALEIGFARANGIPIFCANKVEDPILRYFVQIAESPEEIVNMVAAHQLPPPPPAVETFQNYYKQAAVQRGYHRESAQNCLLLMVEEVGELARAIRKREKLARHSPGKIPNEALELADIFIYVVHMANVLQLDLSKVVQQKELLNLEKFMKTLGNDHIRGTGL
jgi:NTP pyrophosphatase (non-canonical NTP hydrolase)